MSFFRNFSYEKIVQFLCLIFPLIVFSQIHLGEGAVIYDAENSINTKEKSSSEIYVIGGAKLEGISSQYAINYIKTPQENSVQKFHPTHKKEKLKALTVKKDKKLKRIKNNSYSAYTVTPFQNNSFILIAFGKKEICFTTSNNKKQSVLQFSSLAIIDSFYKYTVSLPEYRSVITSSDLSGEAIIRPPPVFC